MSDDITRPVASDDDIENRNYSYASLVNRIEDLLIERMELRETVARLRALVEVDDVNDEGLCPECGSMVEWRDHEPEPGDVCDYCAQTMLAEIREVLRTKEEATNGDADA